MPLDNPYLQILKNLDGTNAICNDPVNRACLPCECKIHRLEEPKIVATATDGYLTPVRYLNDPLLLDILQIPYTEQNKWTGNFPDSYLFGYGQDITHATGRSVPQGTFPVGNDEPTLKSKMYKLLDDFAGNDASGMARRLFDKFMNKKNYIRYFNDADLNNAVENHENIKIFCGRVISAPHFENKSVGKTRIHQALQANDWDIKKIKRITDLGPPAFNIENWIQADDWSSGLRLMINGVQHVVVVANDYYFDRCKSEYYLNLTFLLYDVFGLDDEDVQEYGITKDLLDMSENEGISAWWQLQHQYNYAPLITRAIFKKEYTIPV